MARTHQRRIRKVLRALAQQEVESVMLLGSATYKSQSADQSYPFRQDSNFFYLTGSLAPDLLLLLGGKDSPILLVAPPLDRVRVLWEGSGPRVKDLAHELGATLLITKTPDKEILSRIKGYSRLFFQNETSARAWMIAQQLVTMPPHRRGTLPSQFHQLDEILTPLRIHKEPEEIKLIREAAQLTNGALFDAIPLLSAGLAESFAAGAIDFFFRTREASPAFATIVAAGKNAATLHHTPSTRAVRRGELMLIDCGAERSGYCADITRVVPISGEFSPIQAQIYSGVLRAQRAAIRAVKSGALIRDVHLAAAEELTETLLRTRILRGKRSTLLKKKAYQPYFPHSIGHSLGLDVHDVGNHRAGNGRLEAGMVFTIEPGLYFPKQIGNVPALGIRIEDDVLVTKRGCEVLTDGFPKEIDQVEALMNA